MSECDHVHVFLWLLFLLDVRADSGHHPFAILERRSAFAHTANS
jgi:hypothetical protein